MPITLNHYLTLSAILFTIGMVGIVIRRNILMILLSMEILLNAANLAFVAFSRALGNLDGQVFVFFTITVAAAEVAVGLALVVVIYRSQRITDANDLRSLKW